MTVDKLSVRRKYPERNVYDYCHYSLSLQISSNNNFGLWRWFTVESWTYASSATSSMCNFCTFLSIQNKNKKAQLSLTKPRDAKACQKLLQFDVLTTLSLTILAYPHAFSCCCIRNLRNLEKFTKNSNLWSLRSSKVIDLGANRKPICDLILVINSNFSRVCYRFRDIHG